MMNDELITRTAVMESLTAEYNRRGTGDGLKLAWIEKAVSDTPSAQPVDKDIDVPVKDCISRQMLLEYIHGEPVGKLLCDKYNLDGLIEQFPSVQPNFDITVKIDKAYDDGYETGYLQGRHDWGDLDE